MGPAGARVEREAEGWLREQQSAGGRTAPPRRPAGAREWQAGRDAAMESGARPSMRVETAHGGGPAGPAAESSRRRGHGVRRDFARPRGKRFGTLVHSVLAEIDLGAGAVEVAKVAPSQAHSRGASAEGVAAAARAVEAALSHPLIQRAASAAECRRDESIAHLLADGTLLEGVVDLGLPGGRKGGRSWTSRQTRGPAITRGTPRSSGSTAPQSRRLPESRYGLRCWRCRSYLLPQATTSGTCFRSSTSWFSVRQTGEPMDHLGKATQLRYQFGNLAQAPDPRARERRPVAVLLPYRQAAPAALRESLYSARLRRRQRSPASARPGDGLAGRERHLNRDPGRAPGDLGGRIFAQDAPDGLRYSRSKCAARIATRPDGCWT